jgi:hypothetical protein
VNILMQGMRRSGTTIAFDGFWEDGRFDCFYEPLAAARATSGGGSAAHHADLFDPVRAKRDAFLASHASVRWDDLNHGAPRAPSLELEATLPTAVRAYLGQLFDTDRTVVAKFTRLACKIDELHALQPDALFVHLVRDPRSVTASHLFGRNGVHRDRFKSEDRFFTRRSRSSTWSYRPLSQAVLRTPSFAHLRRRIPDAARVLVLWTFLARETHRAGRQLYGDRYVIVRHEDLTADPSGVVGGLYERAGLVVPAHVERWLQEKVRPARAPFAEGHPAWRAWADRIGMQPELDLFDYRV